MQVFTIPVPTEPQYWFQQNLFHLTPAWPGVVLQLRLKTKFGPGLSLPAVSKPPKDPIHCILFYSGGTRGPRNAKKYEKKDPAVSTPGDSRAAAPKASASGRKRPGDSGADPTENGGANPAASVAPKKKPRKTKQ